MEYMEDLYLTEEAEMVPVRQSRRRVRRDIFDLPDFDFYRTTRFTKDGVRDLTARLEHHLVHADGRGVPITPLHQVHKHTVLTKGVQTQSGQNLMSCEF